MRVYRAVADFRRKSDAFGRPGASGLQNITAVLGKIASGSRADSTDENWISETTVLDSARRFCKATIECFGKEYTRRPNIEDVCESRNVIREGRISGMPEVCRLCVWVWKHCTKALQGIHVGKDGEPMLRMDVICDLGIWTWSSTFGFP